MSVVVPFATVWIITGILSLFPPSIQKPPWAGLGMILNLSILIIWLGVRLAAFAKSKSEMVERRTLRSLQERRFRATISAIQRLSDCRE